ncbi:oxidoreductase domain protein [Beutenbergia cavernae DSM 12333]|uniref:Oxidoreductase domain protein n=1 Tax=Beutenbergia cavernae (strain ATCC BAA-8 / DSM 12333 / CCUG 43141 / JCM 11478 / NBRC 16432 / NCIMB 13614 / HKI 0122) TaxID=471853 RepID=C5BXS6_BEUC1|nr:aldo/keto reductase [Beutenbergia cavernae]ACQ78820.1 oxidoreductase domain protein [Beutenbergia cavernae DSM 12333]
MSAPFRWAILGPGSIAARFASQLPHSEHGVLAAVASSDPDRALAFAEQHGAGVTGDYATILGRDDVDAVYVSTVHTTHARLTIAALEAGKHVLCEKPLAPNHGSVMAMVDAARGSGRVLLEAYMYRFHPLTRQILELVASGAVGELQHVDASFSFHAGRTTGRLFDPALAGGGILDVGGYPVSYARAIAGAAAGRAFVEPTALSARGTIGETGVDEWTVADLTFPDGVTASVRTGVRLADPTTVTIYGSRGSVTLTDPWTLGAGDGASATLRVVGAEPQQIETGPAFPYALEADAVALAAWSGAADVPEASLDDSLGTARVLQQWRDAIGLVYPFEDDDADVPTVSGRPLALPTPGTATIPHGTIDGVGDLSRLVMGCDNQPDLAHASALFDAFVEAGGSAFDTAYIYGGGRHEVLLGRWMANRGVRDDVVVIAKGAHTPHCDPESIPRQLTESLDRLGTDHADLYLMHRDNPAVPVGEFVDVLDAEVRAGRVRAFGGSNWTPERLDEANAYASAHGKTGFAVVSNHFGLAEAYDVPWTGCEHATDAASRAWLTERQMPLLPWSSQARGFFAGRAHPDDRSDAELVRCYYSPENFERLHRAGKLAAGRGVATTAVALAYVLAQPFPTFPLIGPRSIAELRSSLEATRVALTPEEVAWLDLRTDSV